MHAHASFWQYVPAIVSCMSCWHTICHLIPTIYRPIPHPVPMRKSLQLNSLEHVVCQWCACVG